MGTRLELQSLLEGLDSSLNVYFQPPANVNMSYPAIVYNREFMASTHADNVPYSRKWRYQITVIASDPDSPIPDKVADLPMSNFVRHFTANNLNHDIFYVYY